jgi:methylmalonyl-CoA mutase N-terminal domain/subunit
MNDNSNVSNEPEPTQAAARARWEAEYAAQAPTDDQRLNRSRIPIKPIYGPDDWSGDRFLDDVGFPGQPPGTRGNFASGHRGRPWSPRMVVGLGVPEDYNKRMRDLYDLGLTGLFVSPCNSHLRGYDADEVDRELLGVCGTLICTTDDMARCLEGIPFDSESISMGDTAPYTLTAMLLDVARSRSIPWSSLVGTTNQSDYLSHYAALHMFYRLDLPGQKRVLLDHVEWMSQNVPRWNPISVVGQHFQQAGATPAESMGFALSSAIQYATDLSERGLQPDDFLPRFSFFFDVSISFFEEIAKFRAGRRIWNRITRERFGAVDSRSHRFRFHAQTSGADLTQQQPLNNIARVTVHAMAGILGGLQSLHTDAYDEAIASPTEDSARIAVATQNILREEAGLADVVDPLGGSWYVETMTTQMEDEIVAVIEAVDAQGGMFAAVQNGYVQARIGASSMEFQDRVDNKEQIVVGVNDYTCVETEQPPVLERPDPAKIEAYLTRLESFRNKQDRDRVTQSLDDLESAFDDESTNTYAAIVSAIGAGATHGEVCHRVRRAVGFGQPLVAV